MKKILIFILLLLLTITKADEVYLMNGYKVLNCKIVNKDLTYIYIKIVNGLDKPGEVIKIDKVNIKRIKRKPMRIGEDTKIIDSNGEIFNNKINTKEIFEYNYNSNKIKGPSRVDIGSDFYVGTKTISGSINWTQNYYNGDSGSSIFAATPSFGYFFIKNLSLVISLNIESVSYPQKWNVDNSCNKRLGFGIKYYKNIGYGGITYNIKKQNDINEAQSSILLEGGTIFKIHRNVFADLGFDFNNGIGGNKTNTLTLGIGISTFF